MAKKKAGSAKKEEKKGGKSLSKAETESKILELAKKDVQSSKIGHLLKKDHGVKRAKNEVGKINKLLAKHGKKRFPEELQNLMDKAGKLKSHLEKNKKDMTAKRGLQITEAKIRNLGYYFKKSKVLEKNWQYK